MFKMHLDLGFVFNFLSQYKMRVSKCFKDMIPEYCHCDKKYLKNI